MSELKESGGEKTQRRPYEPPTLLRVELAIDETLADGCKLGSDTACVGPPITAMAGGS